jgi:hypothetical protein
VRDHSSSKGLHKPGQRGKAEARRNGKADFMLLEADIRRGLAARQSMRFIYETHAASFGFGYIQFTKYVKALIKASKGAPAQPAHRVPAQAPLRPAAPPAPPLASSPSPHQPRQAPREEPRRFHFDPMSVNRKNLI